MGSGVTIADLWKKVAAGISYAQGFVGIGVDAPTQPLEVVSATSGYMAAFRAIFAGGSGAVLRVYKANGTPAAPRRAVSGNTLGGINAFGYEAVDSSTDAVAGAVSGQFLFRAAENFTATTKGANFRLSICPIGSIVLFTTYEISHDGTLLHFNIGNLPTAAAGLNAGDLWCDTAAGNVIKMV